MIAGQDVHLPALDGLDPLGFLAALGVLRLLEHRGVDARLSFDPKLATARMTGVASIDEIVGHLVSLVEELPPDGLMVGLPPGLFPKKQGMEGSDPGRLTPLAFASVAASAADGSTRSWVRALWTDLAVDEKGRCALTPLSAPAGQQTLRSMFEKPTHAVRAAPRERLEEALRAWRRVDGFTGEYLDRRAVGGAAEHPDGEAKKMGVPGATWLALSAIPAFPMGGDGRDPRTLCWRGRRANKAPKEWRWLNFGWPVWRTPLDMAAVGALLAHPAVDAAARFAARESVGDELVRRQLISLSVERVVVARRQKLPGVKSAGVLTPAGSWS